MSDFTQEQLNELELAIEKYRVEKDFNGEKVRYFSVEAETKYLNDIGILKGDGIKDDRFVDFQVYQNKIRELWKNKGNKEYADRKLREYYENKGYGKEMTEDLEVIDTSQIPF